MALKILAVDDSATMRTIMKMTFAGEDAEVLTVTNGEDAIAKAKAAVPDLVFADASMSGVDGYEVARAIRAEASLSRTAVIVMASQHHPYDDAKAKACGVDDHILKPFDSKVVIEKTNSVVAARRASAGSAPAVAAAPPVAAAPAPVAPAAPAAAPAPVAPPTPAAVAPPTPAAVAPKPPTPAAPVQPRPAAQPAAPAAPAASAVRAPRSTAAFDGPSVTGAAAPATAPARSPSSTTIAAMPAPAPAARVTAPSGDMAAKLAGLGLSADQVSGVLALSREVIEQVVWEVVPELAEALIKEEIKRLTAE
ncbi:MAG: response regulator [Sandaracinaceae bacterium]|nr:response regulator [Sandaracinaceae bacterium]